MGRYINRELAARTDRALLAPQIWTIEEFTTHVSQLRCASTIELLFDFYDIYTAHRPQDSKDTFERFVGYGRGLLNDFNEVDRYLVDADQLFNNLGDVLELGAWKVEGNTTDMVQSYLQFWKDLDFYYKELTQLCREQHKGYQGLIYRDATDRIPDFLKKDKDTHFVFLGFNALNRAEETIIKTMRAADRCTVHWDASQSIIENNQHEAGLFMRRYAKEEAYGVTTHTDYETALSNRRNMHFYDVPGSVAMAKKAATTAVNLTRNPDNTEPVALVLADESLLLPILSAIPADIQANITMGLPLQHVQGSIYFTHYLHMQRSSTGTIYYKDVLQLLHHPYSRLLLGDLHVDSIVRKIAQENMLQVNYSYLEDLLCEDKGLYDCAFAKAETAQDCISKVQTIIARLKKAMKALQVGDLELEQLHAFYQLFNALAASADQHAQFKSLQTLYLLYEDALSQETLDFEGSLDGQLQIMGLLETRGLDFEHIVMTGVNEGTLPSGKSNTSHIPYDLKQYYKLPTYRDKDAIYAYHFYRTLFRSREVHLFYNSISDGMGAGGEVSRFVQQLQAEVPDAWTLHHHTVSPQLANAAAQSISVPKTVESIEYLKRYIADGISPSAITKYLRNPLDFYVSRVLQVREDEEADDTLSALEIGNVAHNTMEELYKPYQNEQLTQEHFKKFKQQASEHIAAQLNERNVNAENPTGVNAIVAPLLHHYVDRMLETDRKAAQQGELILRSIEDKMSRKFTTQSGVDVCIKGLVDRIDELDGTYRIIDYKTGNLKTMKVHRFEEAPQDDKTGIAMQVLAYAYMSQDLWSGKVARTGAISFKKMGEGYKTVGIVEKPSERGSGKTELDTDTMELFEHNVGVILDEMLDPDIPWQTRDDMNTEEDE